jgi:hypothetical protein
MNLSTSLILVMYDYAIGRITYRGDERAILLQMAYIWSRLAEQAAALAKGDAP